MTTALDSVRYNFGMAGEEVANYVDALEERVSKDSDLIAALREQLAAKQQQINAFYSGNPNGGIVARLQEQLTAVTATLEQYKRENTDQHHDIDRLRGLLAVAEKDRDELLAALEDAATSLETIQLRSYGDESYLNTMQQVRGYAGSMAGVAKESVKKAKGAA